MQMASARLSSIPWWLRAEKPEKWEASHLNQNPQQGLFLETEFVKRQIPEWQLREEEAGAWTSGNQHPTAAKQRRLYRLPAMTRGGRNIARFESGETQGRSPSLSCKSLPPHISITAGGQGVPLLFRDDFKRHSFTQALLWVKGEIL